MLICFKEILSMALVRFLSFCISSDYYDVFQFENESKFYEPSLRLGEGL